MISFGAPESIIYESKPHLGTDIIRKIIINIRKYLEDKGVHFKFSERVDDFLLENKKVRCALTAANNEYTADVYILAIGHSARDTYHVLNKRNIFLQKKGFAVGIRVEHPAELIKEIQYGNSIYKDYLPPAEYSLTYNNKKTNRGVYSFCMCPGGSIINSSSENNHLCTNGMSFSSRDSKYSNTAIVVTVNNNDFNDSIFSGIEFQKMIEQKSFLAGGSKYYAPAQRITSFLKKQIDTTLPHCDFHPGITPSDITNIFPEWITSEIHNALLNFNQKMKGFVSSEGIIICPETRTSSPIRIVRNENFESVSAENLYPIGEGSGYAGGIVSSAVDGIRAAQSIVDKYGKIV